MSQFQLFDVDFQIVKANATGPGSTFAYRRPVRRATIKAASSGAGDILSTLTSNISLGSGETIEVLSVRPGAVSGTEGGSVLA